MERRLSLVIKNNNNTTTEGGTTINGLFKHKHKNTTYICVGVHIYIVETPHTKQSSFGIFLLFVRVVCGHKLDANPKEREKDVANGRQHVLMFFKMCDLLNKQTSHIVLGTNNG